LVFPYLLIALGVLKSLGGSNMSIISIANQKGGVGKTTTTIHLADFLSQKKLKTLVIDFDPQAHSTFSLCGQGHKAKKISDGLLSNSR
jgi:chromosome partitioning protein